MQVIGKTMKTSHFIGRNWREELQNMLPNDKCAPHVTIRKSALSFNRDIKNKSPSVMVEKSTFDKNVRKGQKSKYTRVKRQETFLKHEMLK